MNPGALMDWLDDRINPIVIKELRQAVKSRMVVAILMLFLGVQLFVLGLFLIMREARGGLEDGGDWTAGKSAFTIQQIILLWTIGILVPAYAAIRMASERSDNNVDLMFISTLRPSSIVWGKFFAALVLGMLIFSTCAPFMTFTYLLRGIDIPTILTVLAIDLVTMLFGIMTALFVSALPGMKILKFIYSFAGFIGLIILTWSLSFGTVYLIDDPGEFFGVIVDYWPVTVSFLAGVFAVIGLVFCYAVSIISPPTSNRMVLIRSYLLVLCVVTLTGTIVSSFTVMSGTEAAPLMVFMFLIMPILFLQFWISICERDTWGPRVTRTIPRWVLLRPLAFLLYSGSAGGILFSTLLITISLMVCCARLAFLPAGGMRAEEAAWRILLMHIVVALYVACYGQTAVLVRRYILSSQIRQGYTWVIAGLLVGLGTTVPPIAAYLYYSDQMRYGMEYGWWYVPNPFIAYINAIADNNWRSGSAIEEYDFLCLWFLATWGVILILLSLRWFVEQVVAFRPPAQKPVVQLAEVTLVDAEDSVASGKVEGRIERIRGGMKG